jgi:integrase
MKLVTNWTPGDTAQFLAAVRGTRLEAAWHLVAFGSLRVSELLALRWSDVDIDVPRLMIRDAVVGVPYSAIAPGPSSNRARTVDLVPDLADQLARHLTRQETERSEWGGSYCDNGLVVCRENGSPLHPRTLSRAFDAAVMRSGLEPAPLSSVRLVSGQLLTLAERRV